ncbi:reactive intermediate/imine deaminase [Anaerocolumna cellulosilytica]|uniref:Reactive intermediate/imine deaminase n=1 Tax=Anaerocolumna cellulosilytica TaxID=433286 RepID=A0A6S6RCU7_9FIRM|nr:RidA family protein [Anaerocolumna cellulosilytica]MBB5195166.1 2-iminobutanoate/2-iminopropanoate deaminase [Anaerocolumna cellulosilytica]BCJ96638.1 reactive intermediate/imine deaminase [Anaerocolumna cellulosilytica]
MKKIISTTNAPAAIGPYSQAVAINDIIYTSGVIPINPEDGSLVTGDIKEQAERVLKNLSALLESCGTSLDKVIKTTVFIKNMDDFAALNEVYAKYFTKDFPARSCVEVARLPKDVLVEIEAIAEL